MASNLAHSNVNDTRFADLSKVVTKLGKDSADGADALPKLAFAVVTAAYDGVIDTEAKHDLAGDGNLVDDAAMLYTTYLKAEGKKLYQDYKANGMKANVSKLRQLVELGTNPNCDGPKVLTRANEMRTTMAAEAPKSVQSAYPAFVSVARAQKDMDHEITDDELRQAIGKKTSPSKDIADYVKGVKTKLEKLISGENADGIQSQDERIIAAYEQVSNFLSLCEKRAEYDAMIVKARELGFELVNDTSELETSELAA